MDRRDFVKKTLGTAGAVAVVPLAALSEPLEPYPATRSMSQICSGEEDFHFYIWWYEGGGKMTEVRITDTNGEMISIAEATGTYHTMLVEIDRD